MPKNSGKIKLNMWALKVLDGISFDLNLLYKILIYSYLCFIILIKTSSLILLRIQMYITIIFLFSFNLYQKMINKLYKVYLYIY